MNVEAIEVESVTSLKNKLHNQNVTFSFIIPALNEEINLDLCLKSLMKQTHKDFEVILIDGGSKDRTIEIARQYGITVIEVEKTRVHDVSVAKNVGVKNSNGNYLFFLDADMVLESNCIEVLRDIFLTDDVVGVSLRVLPYKGTTIENILYEFNNILCKFSNLIKIYQISYFSCHCYRKDSFIKVGGFRNDLLACEDMDLSLRISNIGKFHVIHKTTLWTSPRRLREWTTIGYILKYLKYLFEYYLIGIVKNPYIDLT